MLIIGVLLHRVFMLFCPSDPGGMGWCPFPAASPSAGSAVSAQPRGSWTWTYFLCVNPWTSPLSATTALSIPWAWGAHILSGVVKSWKYNTDCFHVKFYLKFLHINCEIWYQYDTVLTYLNFDGNYAASERPVCAGSSLCLELKPRWWNWIWPPGCRLQICGPSSDPSPHRWAPRPFKAVGTAHHPGFP